MPRHMRVDLRNTTVELRIVRVPHFDLDQKRPIRPAYYVRPYAGHDASIGSVSASPRRYEAVNAAILVIGVGNTLRRDEGAGVYAVRYLQHSYQGTDTEFLDAGTLSF